MNDCNVLMVDFMTGRGRSQAIHFFGKEFGWLVAGKTDGSRFFISLPVIQGGYMLAQVELPSKVSGAE